MNDKDRRGTTKVGKPMEAPGLGLDLLPAVFERSDLTVRRSSL